MAAARARRTRPRRSTAASAASGRRTSSHSKPPASTSGSRTISSASTNVSKRSMSCVDGRERGEADDHDAPSPPPRRTRAKPGAAGCARAGGGAAARSRAARPRHSPRVPGHVAAKPLLEARGRHPAELGRRTRAAHRRAGVVPVAARDILDRDVADTLAHGLGDLGDADVLAADEVVGAPGGHGLERGHDARGKVLDVDEAARLRAVAGDGERLARERLGDERRDHRGRSRARPVGDAEAQDRGLDAIVLSGRRGSRARRRAWSPCRDAPARAAGATPRGTRRGCRSRPRSSTRRGTGRRRRAAPPRARSTSHARFALPNRQALGHPLDVGGSGQVDHGVAAARRVAQSLEIPEIATHEARVAAG